MFYTSLHRFMDAHQHRKASMHMDAATRVEFEAWKKKAYVKLYTLLGLDRMRTCELNPRLLGTEKLDGYRREKWLIDTEPGIIMPFYALIPDDMHANGRFSCVIAPHGHGSAGKLAVVGNRLFPELSKSIDEHNYDYGVQAVRRGIIALCPDARGFGERREKYYQSDKPADMLRSSCEFLNAMAIPLGMNVAGMWTWDLMRLMDYAMTREDVDADRIGCIGLSGGGLQTLYFTAMDDRVKCAVISGYFYGFREALQEELCCNCNYVPHLWEHFDVGDIGAMIAPRPLVIETGTRDTLNGKSNMENVYPYVEQVRSAYRLYDKEDDLCHDVFDGPHMWHGTKALEWLDIYLKGSR